MLHARIDQASHGGMFQARQHLCLTLEPGEIRARHLAEQQLDRHRLRHAVHALCAIHDAHAADADALAQPEIAEYLADFGFLLLRSAAEQRRGRHRVAFRGPQQGFDLFPQQPVAAAGIGDERGSIDIGLVEGRYENLVGAAPLNHVGEIQKTSIAFQALGSRSRIRRAALWRGKGQIGRI